jgi:uncharacterized membrane protein YccC
MMNIQPILVKYLLGQHIQNGLIVSLGVCTVTAFSSLFFGWHYALAVGLGAMCVSVGDTLVPLRAKFRILPYAWLLSVIASYSTALTLHLPLFQGLTLIALSFYAGMVVGYGRFAVPLSMVMMFSIVFTLGMPNSNISDNLMFRQILFCLGGGSYVITTFFYTWILGDSSKSLALADCLKELSSYLNAVADFYDSKIELDSGYRFIIEKQASFAQHLQSARNQIFSFHHDNEIFGHAHSLFTLLEIFDLIVAVNADILTFRSSKDLIKINALFYDLIKNFSNELDHNANRILLFRGQASWSSYSQSKLIEIEEELKNLDNNKEIPSKIQLAARIAYDYFKNINNEFMQFTELLIQSDHSKIIHNTIRLKEFITPFSLSPVILWRKIGLSSLTFRHAIRLSAAIGFGYFLTLFLPNLSHSNWILLTIAVILRANFSAMRKRRDQRIFGTILGCIISALLLYGIPSPFILLIILALSIGIAHAFIDLDYRVSATAACINALIILHFLNPQETPPIASRLIDTAIGAVIAYLFTYLLPRWEHQEIPAIMSRLKLSLQNYISQALQVHKEEQKYRLARRHFIETLGIIAESLDRMDNEPHKPYDRYKYLEEVLSNAYRLASRLVSLRYFLDNHNNQLPLEDYENDILLTQKIVLNNLTDSKDLTFPIRSQPDQSSQDLTLLKASQPKLFYHCRELCEDSVRFKALLFKGIV